MRNDKSHLKIGQMTMSFNITIIFNELYDRNSLHSCLLVNKEWCNIVVPILWNRYSWSKSEKKLFNIILSCLPSSSKQLLSDNDIKLPSTIILKPSLFNYISFCGISRNWNYRKNYKRMIGNEVEFLAIQDFSMSSSPLSSDTW